MNIRSVASFCFIAYLSASALDYRADREFYENACLTCHTMENYLWPRTYKSWELTISNMRGYIGDDSILSEEGGRRIARFLTEYVGEGVLLVPPGVEWVGVAANPPGSPALTAGVDGETVTGGENLPAATIREEIKEPSPPVKESSSPEPSGPPAAVERPPQEPVAGSVESVRRPKLYMPLLKKIWNPGRVALKGARWTGFLAVAALLGLLGSGFGRKKLKRNFRPLHKRLAWVLFAALAVHGVIYIFEYGTPDVLWYWFGFVGLVVLVAVQVQGKLRRRFKLGPLSLHIAAGCAGLVLSILHWIWAWL